MHQSHAWADSARGRILSGGAALAGRCCVQHMHASTHVCPCLNPHACTASCATVVMQGVMTTRLHHAGGIDFQFTGPSTCDPGHMYAHVCWVVRERARGY